MDSAELPAVRKPTTADAEYHGCIRFRILTGSLQGKEIRIAAPDVLTVGRDPQCSIHVGEDLFFSRLHLRLDITPPRCRLTDLGSANGTFVNGIRVLNPIELNHGDRFGGGSTQIELLIEEPFVSRAHPEEALRPCSLEAESPTERSQLTVPTATPPAFGLDPNAPGTLGKRFGSYEFIAELGRGGMGIVYQVRHQKTQQLFAMKLMAIGDGVQSKSLQLFLREASLNIQLKHPRIVDALEVGLFGDQPYLLMEYVPAIDLKSFLAEQRKEKAIRIACWIAVQVLEALDFAHSRGTVHRDVKPSNILAYKHDEKLFVKLADFGLAKNYANAGLSSLTAANDIRGTLMFMSPEQLRDSKYAKPSCDIYSLAASLYRLISGRSHFPFEHHATAIQMLLRERPASILTHCPQLDPILAAIIDRSLSPRVEDRYPNAGELAVALKPFSSP